MALKDVIGCAPFRLPSPRPLTQYEWNIIGSTFALSLDFAAANALVIAVQNQPCVEWKTSAFGPAPAVSLAPYEGLGRWFASLSVPARVAALGTIAQGALCKIGPWQNFYPQVPTWEGGAQNPDGNASMAVANLEPCAAQRKRTAYLPMTGQDLVNLARFVLMAKPELALPIPPFFLNMIQNGQIPRDFLSRSFLVGIEFPGPGERTKVPFCSEIGLIWAPGQGASIADLFGPTGINLAALMAMLTAMGPTIMPSIIPSAIPGMGNVFPQLLQQILGLPQSLPQTLPAAQQQAPNILTAATQVLTTAMQGAGGKPWTLPQTLPLAGLEQGASSPQTPARTGVRIVDEVQGGEKESPYLWVAATAGVAAAVLLLVLVARPQD